MTAVWPVAYADPGTGFGVIDAAHPNGHHGKDFHYAAGLEVPAYAKCKVVASLFWNGIGYCLVALLLEGPNAGKYAGWAHLKVGTRPNDGVILNPGDTVGQVAGFGDVHGLSWTGPHIHTTLAATIRGIGDAGLADLFDPGPGIDAGIAATIPPPPIPEEAMRLIGPPSADLATVLANLPVRGGLFESDMFYPLWRTAFDLTIDPVGVIAQAGKETAWGTFPGKVRPEFFNPAGLKNRVLGLFPGIDDGDNPLAHARFPNWEIGALAQVQHLRAYSGWPVNGFIVDPRYTLVSGQRCETFEELGGHWAPASDYGTALVAIAHRLRGF